MNIYDWLGVKTIINATGAWTAYSGTLMPAEVTDAMNQASRAFVVMEELHIAAGKRIAELIGVEAAHVTSSATAGIAMMGAACMVGCDRERIRRLPDTEGLHDEFVVQRTHRKSYDQAIRTAGGKFVQVEPNPRDLEEAINDKTAAIFYTFSWLLLGDEIPLPQVVEIAHARGVPVIVDAASELPPATNLRRFLEEGADLVVFSGGKGLRGPQSTGLVLGRKDLVEACRLNDCPNAGVGRAMKTGKEDIVGLVKAVELYVSKDHDAEMSVWERRVSYILGQLNELEHVQAKRQLPYGTGQLFPHVALTWDEAALGMTYAQLREQLLAGPPRIISQIVDPKGRPTASVPEPQIRVHVHCLREGEDVIVAQRLQELLGSRSRQAKPQATAGVHQE